MNRYAREIFQLRCAPDLLASGIYPNAKEWCEARAMVLAVRRFWPDIAFSDRGVMAICPGDGRSPRTGAMVAFTTGWSAWSVDPEMQSKPEWDGVHRLMLTKERIEDVSAHVPRALGFRTTIVLATHAHCRLTDAVEAARRMTPGSQRLVVVSMPCCLREQQMLRMPGVFFRDRAVESPCNFIYGWDLANGVARTETR